MSLNVPKRPDRKKKFLELASEKGASSWLSALPLMSLGYCLNKSDFRDSLCLRYGWSISKAPRFCACGKKNSVDHSLSCKKGGYTIFRHNALRDTEADILKDICWDVQTEPQLLPTDPDTLSRTANSSDQARLDIVATGLWSPFERTFFDVRITHPTAPSNDSKTLEQLYRYNEKEKRTAYEQRVLQVEKATFCPLIYTTTGGMGHAYHKRVAQRLAEKRKDNYPAVMNYVRTKVRFALLKSVLISLRGIRGKQMKESVPTSSVSFDLIPEGQLYEAY